jgi:hypothetical protein
MSEGDRHHVNALKEQYNPTMAINDSVLTGHIR